jgi:site-specific DNA recombinase
MMAGLAAGRFQALVVRDVDRLTRTARELEDVVDLAERHGVALASVGGEIDLATPQGRLTARIKGNMAKHESEQLARRVRVKMAERAEAGQPRAHRLRLASGAGVRRPGPAAGVQGRAARGASGGHPVLSHGHPGRRVTPACRLRPQRPRRPQPQRQAVDHHNGARVLLRERNVGQRVHQGQVVGAGAWEPALDEDTYRGLVALLTDPQRVHVVAQPCLLCAQLALQRGEALHRLAHLTAGGPGRPPRAPAHSRAARRDAARRRPACRCRRTAAARREAVMQTQTQTQAAREPAGRR